jgi:protease I
LGFTREKHPGSQPLSAEPIAERVQRVKGIRILSNELSGKRIAIVVANSGVEQVELTTPREALNSAGAETVLLAPSSDDIQTMNHDVEKGDKFTPDGTIADAAPDSFDALVLPGGVANPDKLRTDAGAVAFVKAIAASGKPIASICHGPWTLVEANLVRGKTLTSWPSLQTDIRNAGGDWRDEESVTCPEQGFTLVTSRKPDDLDAFCAAAIKAFTGDVG